MILLKNLFWKYCFFNQEHNSLDICTAKTTDLKTEANNEIVGQWSWKSRMLLNGYLWDN